MNAFSSSLAATLTEHFPLLENQSEGDYMTLVLPNPNKADIGGLVIQTSEDNELWIRIFPGHSAYLTDSEDDLISIINGVLNDEIFWVIGWKNEEWFETSLVYSTEDIEAAPDVMHYVFSWSGEKDVTITT